MVDGRIRGERGDSIFLTRERLPLIEPCAVCFVPNLY